MKKWQGLVFVVALSAIIFGCGGSGSGGGVTATNGGGSNTGTTGGTTGGQSSPWQGTWSVRSVDTQGGNSSNGFTTLVIDANNAGTVSFSNSSGTVFGPVRISVNPSTGFVAGGAATYQVQGQINAQKVQVSGGYTLLFNGQITYTDYLHADIRLQLQDY